jgi:hypothetical protein
MVEKLTVLSRKTSRSAAVFDVPRGSWLVCRTRLQRRNGLKIVSLIDARGTGAAFVMWFGQPSRQRYHVGGIQLEGARKNLNLDEIAWRGVRTKDASHSWYGNFFFKSSTYCFFKSSNDILVVVFFFFFGFRLALSLTVPLHRKWKLSLGASVLDEFGLPPFCFPIRSERNACHLRTVKCLLLVVQLWNFFEQNFYRQAAVLRQCVKLNAHNNSRLNLGCRNCWNWQVYLFSNCPLGGSERLRDICSVLVSTGAANHSWLTWHNFSVEGWSSIFRSS